MEFLVVAAVGVLLFLLVRALMQRQAQRMNERLKDAVTPENARMAAKTLTDEQYKDVYQAIAADDGRRALALFRQATGAKIQDCIIAVQALHAYPQPTPSELHLQDETTSSPSIDGIAAAQTGEHRDDEDPLGPEDAAEEEPSTADSAVSGSSRHEGVQDEYVEDVIDGVSESEGAESHDAQPTAVEPAGSTGGSQPDENSAGAPSSETPEDVDDAARRLMEESGFDHDAELTVPEEWMQSPQQDLGGFHLEVQRGEEKISLSHEDLEPWVHDQLYALLRDDQLEQASELLAAHSPLTREEAHKFLVVFKNQE